jgi:hypothetical protein
MDTATLANESREFAERSAAVLRAKERLAEIERDEIVYACDVFPRGKSAAEISELLKRGVRLPEKLRRTLRHPERKEELQNEARGLQAIVEQGDL